MGLIAYWKKLDHIRQIRSYEWSRLESVECKDEDEKNELEKRVQEKFNTLKGKYDKKIKLIKLQFIVLGIGAFLLCIIIFIN